MIHLNVAYFKDWFIFIILFTFVFIGYRGGAYCFDLTRFKKKYRLNEIFTFQHLDQAFT